MTDTHPSCHRVTVPWDASYPNALVLGAGDTVVVDESRESEWDDWWWCRGPDGRDGWVPVESLTRQSGGWVCSTDYSAAELTVTVGEIVTVHESLAGWLWCENDAGDEGWIPKETVSEPR